MPDPNLTLTAMQPHATALEASVSRHSANAAQCKIWSAAIVGGVLLLMSSGKGPISVLPWMVVLMGLLALVDAGQAAMARVVTEAYNRFMRKLPINGGNAIKAEEFVLPVPELGWRDTGKVLAALSSFSVWPFYTALLVLLVGFHVQNAPESGMRNVESGKKTTVAAVKASGCGSGGGCGTSGGCGSGGCGASAGKACGCGSEAKAKPAPSATPVPPASSAPGVRPPTMPPAHIPQNASPPQNAVPGPNDAPQNPRAEGAAAPSLPLQNGVPQNGSLLVPEAGETPALQPSPGAGAQPNPPKSPGAP